MEENMIFSSVIILFVLFIFIVPSFLCQGLRKIKDPVPLYLPPLLSILTIGVLAGIRALHIISDEDILSGTIISFFFLLLLVNLAIIAPFPYFGKKIGVRKPWLVFTLPAFAGAFLLFYTTAGEAYYGRPMPPFSAPLPLTGWILDGAASVLGLQDIVYAFGSPVYEILREIGLWLEVLVIAVVYYWVLSLPPKPEQR